MAASAVDPQHRWTAAELRRLPAAERDAILAAAAALAADEYRHDATLTAFEAFGEGDLYVHSSDAQSR
jgi:acyl-CoA reductase-like NAD-dependent aldehyde dehydrogenase